MDTYPDINALGLFINPSYARSGRGVAASCESIPCLQGKFSQTLGPKTKIVTLCAEDGRCHQVFLNV